MKRKILSPSLSPLITIKKEDDSTPPSTIKRKKPSPLKDLDIVPKISKPINKPQVSSTKSNLNMNALHDELASAVQALSAAIQPELDLPELKIEEIPLISMEEPPKIEPNAIIYKCETELESKNRRLSEMAVKFRKHKSLREPIYDAFCRNKDMKTEPSIVEKLLEKVRNFKKNPPNKEMVDIKEEDLDVKDVKAEEQVDELWVEIKDPELLTQEDIQQMDLLIKKQRSENRNKATIITGYGDFLMDMPNKNKFPVIERIENFLRRKSLDEIIPAPYPSSPAAVVVDVPIPLPPPPPPLPPSISVPVHNEDNSDSDSDSESRLIIEVNEPEEDKCKTSPIILQHNPVDVAAKTAIQTIEDNKDITIVRVEKKDLEQAMIQPPPPLLGMTTITPLVYQPVSGSSSPSTGRIFGLPTSIDFSDSGVKPIVDIAQISQDLITQEKKVIPMNPETSLHSLPAETSIRPYLKKEMEIHSDSSSNQHSDSMKMLLCEETIPGSPSPVVGKDIPADIKPLSGAILHPIEANIKHIPMDIESSLDIVKHEISMTAISFNSPHESQDDSCEDIKARLDMDSDISPRKRRRGYPKVMMVNEDIPTKKKRLPSMRRGGEFFFTFYRL